MEAISQERWDALSDRDKELLKSLGVGIAKPKKGKTTNPVTLERLRSTKNTCPEEPYWLKLTKVCECCGTVEELHGEMMQVRKHHSYLSFVQKPCPVGQEHKRRRIVTISCDSCDEVLASKPKEELVGMIKALHKAAAVRSTL